MLLPVSEGDGNMRLDHPPIQNAPFEERLLKAGEVHVF
jgi:hypothetical protein